MIAGRNSPIVMQMKYPYTNPPGLRPGNYARPGLVAGTTMDAILSGERTATTRFPMWYRNNPGQLDLIKAITPGQVIEFYDGSRRAKVQAIESPLSRQQMAMAEQYPELRGLNGATYALSLKKLQSDPKWLDRWSQLEGWNHDAALQFFRKEPLGYGYQFQYRLI